MTETSTQTTEAPKTTQATQDASLSQLPPAETVVQQGASTQSAPARPDGLPDQFFDEASGVKLNDLIKSYGELDAFRAQQEVKASLTPKTPDAYELKLPAELKLPDGIEIRLDEKSPLLKAARDYAHTVGLSQQQFEGLAALHATHVANEAAFYNKAHAEFISGLGANGTQRISNVSTALANLVGEQGASDLMTAVVTKAGIEAVERLIGNQISSGAGQFSQSGRMPASSSEDARLRAMYPSMKK